MSTSQRLHIRDAYESEGDAVREVTQAAYKEYAAVMPAPLWTGYWRRVLATLETKGSVERIVAVQDGTMVGSVFLYPPAANVYGGLTASAIWPEVRLLAVVPAARGQGIGIALMNECERRACSAGATALGLHTMDMMEAAVRMYERMGFVHVPELDFSPAAGMYVKGYRRSIGSATLGTAGS